MTKYINWNAIVVLTLKQKQNQSDNTADKQECQTTLHTSERRKKEY